MRQCGALYVGSVAHRRRQAPSHRFRYRVFMLLLDLDRLDQLDRSSWLFGHNRLRPLSLYDRDHGPKDGSPLRPWIDAVLCDAGVHLQGGRVRLLCYPRVFGHAFNPLSLWYCEHADGSLRAVLCEVRNTFGEWHGYLLHEGGRPMEWPVRASARKCFHVSPFLPDNGGYRFRLDAPEQRLRVAVTYQDAGQGLAAVQQGDRRELTDGELARALAGVPLLSLKVVGGIHWEALKLWLRGARLYRKPPPPVTEISP